MYFEVHNAVSLEKGLPLKECGRPGENNMMIRRYFSMGLYLGTRDFMMAHAIR